METDRYAELHAQWRWEVPRDFNIAEACCRRWAGDPERIALYWEDESGETATLTFAAMQAAANRLSHALAAAGVRAGDCVAIILPQRPETAIAHIACYQMGAVALPLSFLFGPEALEYRLADGDARAALVDAASWPNLQALRDRLPRLGTVVSVAGLTAAGLVPFEEFLAPHATHFEPVGSLSRDPAVLIYTSGTTGPPKGALMPQQALLGNLPGFIYSHDLFPQPGDFFWSPADWAWTGGLMDALLPTLYFGFPILGYRGRFEAEKAFALLQKYAVRNTFLFPTALKLMMKALPHPRERFDLKLRSVMSAGEAVGSTVFEWSQRELGVTINEMFGQTEMNYIVGNSHTFWPARAGSMGKAYPGHRVALIDEVGAMAAPGEIGEIAVHRYGSDGSLDPVFFLGYHHNAEATSKKFSGDWCRTGDLATEDAQGYLWYQGRADDMFKSAGYRIGPSEIENCLVKHPAVANAAVVPSPDETRGAVIKAFIVLAPGQLPSSELEADLQRHVRAFLAPYEYPKEIEFIDALPMTTTGKVQRRVLREREATRKAAKPI
jgi:acetyl-CoA synthetase